jgi:hypothetical protein
MKLYVCYGTWTATGHPCGAAYEALRDAGHDPKVVRAYGLGVLPDMPFNLTPGRRHVKARSGNSMVPMLEFDDGTVVDGSRAIIAWAEAHPVAVSTTQE